MKYSPENKKQLKRINFFFDVFATVSYGSGSEAVLALLLSVGS